MGMTQCLNNNQIQKTIQDAQQKNSLPIHYNKVDLDREKKQQPQRLQKEVVKNEENEDDELQDIILHQANRRRKNREAQRKQQISLQKRYYQKNYIEEEKGSALFDSNILSNMDSIISNVNPCITNNNEESQPQEAVMRNPVKKSSYGLSASKLRQQDNAGSDEIKTELILKNQNSNNNNDSSKTQSLVEDDNDPTLPQQTNNEIVGNADNIIGKDQKDCIKSKNYNYLADQKVVYIKNVISGMYLSSKSLKYQTGSKKQQVTVYRSDKKSTDDKLYEQWVINRVPASSSQNDAADSGQQIPLKKDDDISQRIMTGDKIIITHNLTQRALSSNTHFQSSISKQQEVSCSNQSTDLQNIDSDLIWRIQIFQGDEEKSIQQIDDDQDFNNQPLSNVNYEIKCGNIIKIIHQDTNCVLHACHHNKIAQKGHFELYCCKDATDLEDLWVVEEIDN